MLYHYFCCLTAKPGIPVGTCSTRHYRVEDVEVRIEELYRPLHLPKAVRDQVWDDLPEDAGLRTEVARKETQRHRRKLAKLEDNQARLVQMAYSDLVSDEVLAREQEQLRREKKQIDRMSREAEGQLHDVEEAVEQALNQTSTKSATYMASTPMERRLLESAVEFGHERGCSCPNSTALNTYSTRRSSRAS